MKVEEIRIPAPWGHIAAKSWGDDHEKYVILLHGYADNAGSFDQLVPLLPTSYRYICIDFPGHGYSTPFPKACPVHMIDFTLVVRMVAEYFHKPNYILIGHSLGGIVSIMFTMLYPNFVSKLVTLDILGPYSLVPAPYTYRLQHQFKLYEENQRESRRTCRDYDSCIRSVMKGRQDEEMTYKPAESLAKRMLRKDDNDQYYFEFDKRGKAVILRDGDVEFLIDLYEKRPVTCQFMITLADGFSFNIQYHGLYKYLKTRENVTKTYGEESNPIAIVVHGILENSASFDNLIPLLPNQFHYVCIDLPGHGFSSSFTKGLPVYFEFFTYAIKITMDYFKRDQYILIGHNFGAAVSAFASQIYHDCVSKLVLIDATTPWPKTPTRFAQRLKTAIDTVESSTEEKKTQTYAEVKKNVMRNRLEGVITSEAADLLMKRMVRKVGNDQYVLNHDENINTIIYPSFHFDDIKNMATKVPVRCDGILINYTNASQKHLEYQEKTSKLFPVTRIMVKGHHSYHMTNPDSVAPIISSFLLAPPVGSKL